MSLYFISDLHLGSPHRVDESERVQYLSAFFQQIAGPENRLYIVGDLFDFWFEWRHVIPARHFSVLNILKRLTESGTEVHLLPGNHDFDFRSFLTDEIQVQVHDEVLEFTHEGRRFHLIHGDGVDPADRSYRLLKRVLRHPLSAGLFRLLHPDLGMALADRVSRTSYQNPKDGHERMLSAYRQYAAARFQEGADFVIMGHLHTPVLEQERLLVIGDWIQHFSYGRFQNNRLTSHRFGAP